MEKLISFAFFCAFVASQTTVPVRVVQTAQFTGDRLSPKPNIYFQQQSPSTPNVITINPNQQFQTILGFGGAFTEAAAYVFSQMNEENQQTVLNSYWGPSGHNYSVGRVHMNSCDFSLASYSFDDHAGDYSLTNFNISHDHQWLIPFIQQAMQTSKYPIRLYLTPWSPPAWMKGNGQMTGSSSPGLIQSDDIFSAWALYYSKFLTAYQHEGINFWGLTVQNEPEFAAPWEACVYNPQQEGDFVKNYLGPLIKKQYPDLKIMIYDHNKDHIENWASAIFSDPEAAQYVDGTAFHWYSGPQFENVEATHNMYPDKFLLATEACNCPPAIGSWANGESYAYDIIGDLNAWTVGWVDWNLILDSEGGPNHLGNYCDAQILVDLQNNTLIFQSHYFYMGQISRYLSPGSVRINATSSSSQLNVTAALTPANQIVVVVLNRNSVDIDFSFSIHGWSVEYTIPQHGIASFSFDAGSIVSNKKE